MIIGIDASRANHPQKTGVGWYVYFLIQELKTIVPQNVTVILYSDVPLQGELADLPPHWTSKVLGWPPKRFWTQIRMSYEMLVSPPDILFVPAHVFPLIHPQKTIMTVHDIAATEFPETYSSFQKWYSLWSAKFAAKNLWRVIVPSEFVKKEMISNFQLKDSKNISVIYHGYDEKFLKKISDEKKETVLKQYQVQSPFLLSIGRLESKKNTSRIIEAFEQIKKTPNTKFDVTSLKLVLVGSPGFGYEKVEKSLNQSPCKDDIYTLGWVDKDALPALMQSAKVFVFPSLSEGFGIPVLEAFASGTPVIVSKGSCLEEIGGSGVVAVDALNVNSISNGIFHLLENEYFAQEKIQAGKERVKNFSWKKCAEEVANILLKTL
jgi:glycosyltransferase involved in cell wall biosynthesis